MQMPASCFDHIILTILSQELMHMLNGLPEVMRLLVQTCDFYMAPSTTELILLDRVAHMRRPS